MGYWHTEGAGRKRNYCCHEYIGRKGNVVVETGDSFDTVKAFESLKDEERLNVDKKG